MKKFTTCNTSDKKKRHILRMLPVLTVAGALSIALTGCGTSSEDEVQRYSWPLATASPEDTVTQIFAEKFAEEVAAFKRRQNEDPGIRELHPRR